MSQTHTCPAQSLMLVTRSCQSQDKDARNPPRAVVVSAEQRAILDKGFRDHPQYKWDKHLWWCGQYRFILTQPPPGSLVQSLVLTPAVGYFRRSDCSPLTPEPFAREGTGSLRPVGSAEQLAQAYKYPIYFEDFYWYKDGIKQTTSRAALSTLSEELIRQTYTSGWAIDAIHDVFESEVWKSDSAKRHPAYTKAKEVFRRLQLATRPKVMLAIVVAISLELFSRLEQIGLAPQQWLPSPSPVTLDTLTAKPDATGEHWRIAAQPELKIDPNLITTTDFVFRVHDVLSVQPFPEIDGLATLLAEAVEARDSLAQVTRWLEKTA